MKNIVDKVANQETNFLIAIRRLEDFNWVDDIKGVASVLHAEATLLILMNIIIYLSNSTLIQRTPLKFIKKKKTIKFGFMDISNFDNFINQNEEILI